MEYSFDQKFELIQPKYLVSNSKGFLATKGSAKIVAKNIDP